MAGMSAAYCLAAPGHPLHGPYHDTEYGFPSNDEAVLFERLCLEINQAGLSWLTVLQKRPAFRAAFAGFQVDRVAAFDEADVARLLGDAGIVRNRQKIAAVIANAQTIQGLRRTHGWFGLWGAVLGLLFGVAGIWLNHRAIMKLPIAEFATRKLPPEVIFDIRSLAGALRRHFLGHELKSFDILAGVIGSR